MTHPPSQFESELSAFDSTPAPTGAHVFYGSSSIRLWDNMAQCFPGLPVVNRGFGGSTLAECVSLLPRVIHPLEPATMILYAADNDLDQGASPEHTLYLFQQFVERMRERFPSIPIAFISVKPSPARFWNISNIRRANELIRQASEKCPGVSYLDLFALMLSPAGGSRPDLFTNDGLHMNSAGYELWTTKIRGWLDTLSSAGHLTP
jgi:lysophospholipase L1-like esterase